MANAFRVVFRPEKFTQSLTRLSKQFDEAMLKAARNVMRAYLADVIEGTPKPGDPDEGFNKEYVRTGRLVGGWGAAAAALGLPLAFNGESDYREVISPDSVHLIAENQVPYALFVEYIGPWLIPPNAAGGPTWRGGRHMVENARGNILGGGVITKEVGTAWKAIL